MKINIETKDQIEINGFKENKKKKIATAILCVLTGGLFLIVLSWKPSIKIRFTHDRCPMGEAQVLIIKDIYGQIFEEKVEDKVYEKDGNKIHEKYFHNKKIKYVFDSDTSIFVRLSYPPVGTRITELADAKCLTEDEARKMKFTFGENETDIEVPSLWQLFINQAYNPFYIFQVYTIVLWCIQYYFVYSACIFFFSVISIVLNIWETRRQTLVLREKMISGSKVKVLRNNTLYVMESSEMVPGDIVLIEDGIDQLEADLILLEGSVVTNEAILTGESVPVTKVELPRNAEEIFSQELHKKHVLYSGTSVLQVRGHSELKALVIHTGYDTLKGEMIRSILFPRPVNIQIYSDFLRLFIMFIVLGSVAVLWSLFHWGKYGNSTVIQTLLLSLDLLTFVVPPILPATITAINFYGQKRLQKSQIFCLSSNYISLSGNIDIVCFDKTGTLTEDDLSIEGVLPCEDSEFLPPVEDLRQLCITSKFIHSMVTCHSLIKGPKGDLIGHPLDIKIFDGLGWAMKDFDYSEQESDIEPQFLVSVSTHVTACEYKVFKIFPFESEKQRMTVVAKESSNPYYEVFIKGAPERIVNLCKKESVPENFVEVLEWYSRQGMRILATSFKPLQSNLDWNKISNTEREDLEKDSYFLGLIILQNRLKPETTPALRTIHESLLSTVMITGDNLLTAVNVAKQCGLVANNQQIIIVKAEQVESSSRAAKHLTISYKDSEICSKNLKPKLERNYVFGIEGDSFSLISLYDKETFKKIVHRGKIFARMKPDQKVDVIEALQKLGHQVAMCGDGCNDCGALKAAHAGISLSSSEASVAAPFTSLQRNIHCVSTLIREGRATLISTYTSLKYNIACCFTSLTFMLLLFSIFALASDLQFLIMDLVMFTFPSLLIGNTKAASGLSKQRPTRRILHPIHITSIVSFIGLQALLFWSSWQYLEAQSWYEPFVPPESKLELTQEYEVTVSVLQVFFSYGICAIVFSHDYPFRQPIYTNKLLTFYLLFSLLLATVFTFYQADWLYSLLTLKPFPYAGFTWVLFLSVWVTAAISFFWERFILYGLVETFLSPWIRNMIGSRLIYQRLENSLKSDLKWPPLEAGDQYQRHSSFGIEDNETERLEFVRNLTNRHKFTAEVKYEDELKPLSGDDAIQENHNDGQGGNATITFKVHHSMNNTKGERGNPNNNDRSGSENISLQMSTFQPRIINSFGKASGNQESVNIPEKGIPAVTTTDSGSPTLEENDTLNPISYEKDLNCEGEADPVPRRMDRGSLDVVRAMNDEWAVVRRSLTESLKELKFGENQE